MSCPIFTATLPRKYPLTQIAAKLLLYLTHNQPQSQSAILKNSQTGEIQAAGGVKPTISGEGTWAKAARITSTPAPGR